MNEELKGHIYFLGIGGIGMSALARYFHHLGHEVSGYDKTATVLTKDLENEGISVHYNELPELIPQSPQMVVYTPAIPAGNKEWIVVSGGKYNLKKRAEVLASIVNGMFSIAVAGTHGKTTTTAMISHLLTCAGRNPLAFIGGISKNFGSNLVQPDIPDIAVAEADEYDRSFLALKPDIAVIQSMDADHLDIYGSESFMQESYNLFASGVNKGGVLIYRQGLPLTIEKDTRAHSCSAEGGGDYNAVNIEVKDARFIFDLKYPGGKIDAIEMGIPGRHNIENAVSAVAAVMQLGVTEEVVRKALSTFSGVSRRFDYRINGPGLVYIDDYAHHPEELRRFIGAVKELYPGKRISGIFQPHLFTRTRDFATDFAKSLDVLNEIVLMDIYPARELPIEGIDSNMLLGMINNQEKCLMNGKEIIEHFTDKKPEVLLTMGAGDIDQIVEPLENALRATLN